MTSLLLLSITGIIAITGYFAFRFLKIFLSRPILEISLSPVVKPKWSDEIRITGLMNSFKQKGFEPAGDFECREIPSLIISGFINTREQMTGVIYDHPFAGIWADIIVQYHDKSSLTVSNAPAGQSLDHMPHHAKYYMKGNSFEELFEKVLHVRKDEGTGHSDKRRFCSIFEASYREEMKWRAERGGPTYGKSNGSRTKRGFQRTGKIS